MITNALIISVLCALLGLAAIVWWRLARTEESRQIRLRVALVLFGSAAIVWCVDLVAGFLQIVVTLFCIGWLARWLVFQAEKAGKCVKDRELVHSGDSRNSSLRGWSSADQ